MGITRGTLTKKKPTGGRRVKYRKKRKYELGRQAANTRLSSNVCVRKVRCRGGNIKKRALRLDSGSFSWPSEAYTRRTRIVDVVYHPTSNDLVRTKTLVKAAIVQVDAHPFKQWYQSHYGVELGVKNKEGVTEIMPDFDKMEGTEDDKKAIKDRLNARRALDPKVAEHFQTGRLLACISSRPGQCGKADGYILEGKELEFYTRKMQKKKGKAAAGD
ncbi:hypothetical protein BSKO_06434 [Bryopsis sp. KO-2023]|nr:hypothetical protein BSKO_06434 [Bryopsis sp. KO-2023]